MLVSSAVLIVQRGLRDCGRRPRGVRSEQTRYRAPLLIFIGHTLVLLLRGRHRHKRE